MEHYCPNVLYELYEKGMYLSYEINSLKFTVFDYNSKVLNGCFKS